MQRGVPPPALTLREDKFVEVASGQTVALKGYSWFGFNNGQTSVDGLWAGGCTYHTDFASMVYQMQLLGFNAIRLPFLFKDLSLPVQSRVMPCSPASADDWKQRTTPPGCAVPAKELWQSPVPLPDTSTGHANTYLPEGSTLERLLWAIQHLVAAGMYVLVDYHPMFSEQVALDRQQYVERWAALWRAVTSLPGYAQDLCGRVLLDLLNEPDALGLRWEPAGGKPGITELYLSVMDALYALDPTTIFFINGAGQGGCGTSWGDGFVTDAAIIQQCGLSDPRPFFSTLLNKPYRSQVVISPHVYGPSVTHADAHYKGVELWRRLTLSFGYLTQQGYCEGGDCQRFPVALGEFGSRFQDPRDHEHLRDLAVWMNNVGPAADGRHNAISSWFYWCYNANSGDTGGLVCDQWRELQWPKLGFLSEYMGLRPWHSTANELMHVYRC